jgi:glucose-1-phosphate thymidylyltransferase
LCKEIKTTIRGDESDYTGGRSRSKSSRPHTYTQPKALIPIAGKTILSFIVDQLHNASINEFFFIVGYLGEKIQEYVKQTYPNLSCHFVYQNERQGTGHAIELTRNM